MHCEVRILLLAALSFVAGLSLQNSLARTPPRGTAYAVGRHCCSYTYRKTHCHQPLKTDDSVAPTIPPGTHSNEYSICWLLGERSWEPPAYDVNQYGFVENGTMILDVFGGQPTWPDILGHDRGADGKPCGGWPPREEFKCMNYSWTNSTCGSLWKSRGTQVPGSKDKPSAHTDLGPLCCNPGGCVPQEGNVSAIVALVKSLVAKHVPPGFDGNCVLDQEGYNAIATDVAFGECDWPHQWPNVYRNYSMGLVRHMQPGLPEGQVAAIAQAEWQNATVALMVASLQAAREVRPSCKWGYYGKEVVCSIYTPCAPSPVPGVDPLCGYDHPTQGPKLRKQAEVLSPVVAASDILFPSAYLMSVSPRSHGYLLGLSGLECDQAGWTGPHCDHHTIETQRAGLRSIIGQAVRASAAVISRPPVIPFIWQFCSVCTVFSHAAWNCAPCYENSSHVSASLRNDSFHINRFGIEAALTIPYELGVASVLIWVDIEEQARTKMLESVLHTITGPIGRTLLADVAECSQTNCSGHGRCQPLRSTTCECFAGFTGVECNETRTETAL